ncbi:hypothetical protein D9M72_544550 [compost metagenome]
MRRTMTCFLAIRRMLIAKATEIAIGRPSGIALTASPTAIMNRSLSGMSRATPTSISKTTTVATTKAMSFEKPSSRISNGDFARGAFPISLAILPISLFLPVASTTPRARPRVTRVPAYTMWRRCSSPVMETGACDFLTGDDSPVNKDSSQKRPSTTVSRMSAGTRPPDSSATRSPGTISRVSSSTKCPSRTTLAFRCSSLRNANAAWPAECS